MNSFPIQYFRVIIFPAIFAFVFLSSCKDDEPSAPTPIDYGYVTYIDSPINNGQYTIGDTLPISTRYISETGEIVHYISIEIYSKSNNSIKLYSVQSHQHQPDIFEYNDNFLLKDSSKIASDSEWIIEAALWSHEAEADTVSTTSMIKIEE